MARKPPPLPGDFPAHFGGVFGGFPRRRKAAEFLTPPNLTRSNASVVLTIPNETRPAHPGFLYPFDLTCKSSD